MFDQIEFLKKEIDYLKDQNEWLREMLSHSSSDSVPREIPDEEMIPINRIELPSERKSRLTKKYSDLKKQMKLENTENAS